jgi:hypothetical protein
MKASKEVYPSVEAFYYLIKGRSIRRREGK